MQFNQEIEAQSQVKHHSKNFAHKALAAPKSVAGAIAGVTIGVPVHVTKSISEHSKSMKRSMNEGLDVDEREIDLAGRGMSAMCAYPYGFFSGMIHGTIKGVGRGISSGSKKPFSKESFSIGESTPSQTSLDKIELATIAGTTALWCFSRIALVLILILIIRNKPRCYCS